MTASWVAAALLLSATGYRVTAGKVPNLLFVAALGAAPFLQVWHRGGLSGLGPLVAGMGAAFLVGGYLRLLGVARWGDVKLMIGFAALVGPETYAFAMVLSGVAAVGLAAWISIRRGTWLALILRIGPVLTLHPGHLLMRVDRRERTGSVPLTVLVSVGGLTALVLKGLIWQ